MALAEELDAVMKSLGLSTSGSERPARRNQRKLKKSLEAQPPAVPET
jgi:hypothetical protein